MALLASLLNSVTSVTPWPGLFNISWPFKSTPPPQPTGPPLSAPPPPAPSISVPELLTQRLPPPSPTVTTTPSPSLSPLTHPLYTSAGDAQSPLLTSLTRLICLSSIFLFCWSPPSQRNRNRGNWSACLSLHPPPLPAPSSGPAGWLAGWLA